MTILVGEVIAVHGIKIILKIFDESSKDTIFYKGNKFKGVSIREHLIIQRGFINIACIVEGEFLDESRFEAESNKITYIRKVEVKPIGYFKKDIFTEGIKFLPMIKDPVFLISEEEISKIYHNDMANHDLVIGKMLKENIPVYLQWEKLFNTHIGIFGNTGSGKSNTLAKLYTTLFNSKLNEIKNKSQFILIDFNGEYTNDQLVQEKDKTVYHLNTRGTGREKNKFPISPENLLDSEVLGLLFKATSNTQKPFLDRLVNSWKKYYDEDTNSNLLAYIKYTFKKSFSASSQKKEVKDLLLTAMVNINNKDMEEFLNKISWHSTQEHFITDSNQHFNGSEESYKLIMKANVDKITIENIDFFKELIIRVHLQLTNDLTSSHFQFEHIQPLLKRIESTVKDLEKTLSVSSKKHNTHFLKIISLRKCNQDIKKIIPLLLAKYYYESHKKTVNSPPEKTLHLIIDEAHNVLSLQSTREQESWKDYRLELFEEIIKEGRKFGVFLTLSSQRPADISATIMSQIHNFFIHRLVNDKDLFLLDNTLSTLDTLSKGMIPNLAKGCCIITGTSFNLPLVVQVDKLERQHQPDSEDVNLAEIWR
ncbi:TPA: ATP-binding protein [Legionella pneumophila]|nr:ATP-binding protein [Legionella pneumophila]